jgi:hypothetical protein
MKFRLFLEASDYGPIPSEAGKELWKQVKLITGLPFKNKRFQGDYAAVRDEISGYDLAISGGLLVLQGWQPIPNFEKLVAFLKKHFGNVHTKGQEYINCRKYGEEWREPTGSVEVKPVLSQLPQAEQFMNGNLTVLQVKQQIDQALDMREVKVDGSPKLSLIKKLSITENLVSWNGHFYVFCISTLYQVRDENDARQLVKLINIRSAALRQAEIASWENDDLSNPMGGPKFR